jgi:asparagine synthase (glutamine-hydrolysing)
MCGIAGYYGRSELPGARVDDCLELMTRRGPDNQSFYRGERGEGVVYLLNSRLSIIDLDPRSDQPFRVGSSVMTYNGELYNYIEVRRELEQIGVSFGTRSDTEVLARALERWGESALDRLEGMWAFASYDESSESLLLGRDRFGEKPLYLFETEDGLFFGSEIKFLRALLGRSFDVDHNQIYRYLVNGYKSLYKQNPSFFVGVRELPAGHTLEMSSRGNETAERYWHPTAEPEVGMTYEEAVGGARSALIRAVELRLRADVPLAFCMSGGVDSNSLISVARRCFGHDVHGFTIVNTDERYEEQELVDAAVRELGIKHTPIPVETTDFLDNLRLLVRQHDAPVYTITYYAHWLLMREIAAHGYRISMSGTAADELFSGYFDHHLAYLAAVAGDETAHTRALRDWERWVKPVVRNPHLQDPELFVKDPSFRGHIYLNSDLFAGYLLQPWAEPFVETSFTDDLLRNRMLNELFHEAVPVILHEDDHNAMYFSIENRSPFLDRGLFEFCNRIPTKHLMKDGYAKVVLRDAMRGIAPDAVLDNHRKVGFNAPIHAFLATDDPHVRGTLLDQSPIFEHVRKDRIEALLSRRELPNSESKFLFSFINAKMFLEEFS